MRRKSRVRCMPSRQSSSPRRRLRPLEVSPMSSIAWRCWRTPESCWCPGAASSRGPAPTTSGQPCWSFPSRGWRRGWSSWRSSTTSSTRSTKRGPVCDDNTKWIKALNNFACGPAPESYNKLNKVIEHCHDTRRTPSSGRQEYFHN